MKPEERKISDAAMKFLANYANTYYPISDYMFDLAEAVHATRGFTKAHNILVKEQDTFKNKLKKAKCRLEKYCIMYGRERVLEIVNENDGYSN